MRIKSWQVVTLLILLILGIYFVMRNESQKDHSVLKVWTRFKPTSVDPMSYDIDIHHQTMRSVLASLVSKYKTGAITPQIAKSWSANVDKSLWHIDIDENWTYENGNHVRSEDIIKNFKRIILLKNAQNSKSGFLEYLVGASDLKSINQKIEGIQDYHGAVIFKFIKPMPDFLEKISFGLYSIAHPDNYDENGFWKNPKNVIASSSYKISKWTDDEFELTLRPDFYLNENSLKYKKIIFNFSKDDLGIYSNDLVIKEKINPDIDITKWHYASTTLDNNITYVKVMKWNDKKSIFHDRKNRIKLRNIFYKSLKNAGYQVTTSFFPLSIKDVNYFSYDDNLSFDYGNKFFYSQPYFITPKGNQLGDVFFRGFNDFCQKINAIPKIVEYPKNESEEEKVFDIQFLGTGIVIDSPRDDVNFMFRSKQGINLPDEDGKILKSLESKKFNIQEVNELLWDQGIIWPIRHYSMGFWVKNSSNIDLSEINLMMQPIDFQFIKWK